VFGGVHRRTFAQVRGPCRHRRTLANDPERLTLATVVAPRGGRLTDAPPRRRAATAAPWHAGSGEDATSSPLTSAAGLRRWITSVHAGQAGAGRWLFRRAARTDPSGGRDGGQERPRQGELVSAPARARRAPTIEGRDATQHTTQVRMRRRSSTTSPGGRGHRGAHRRLPGRCSWFRRSASRLPANGGHSRLMDAHLQVIGFRAQDGRRPISPAEFSISHRAHHGPFLQPPLLRPVTPYSSLRARRQASRAPNGAPGAGFFSRVVSVLTSRLEKRVTTYASVTVRHDEDHGC
jgi:hypothetical protein